MNRWCKRGLLAVAVLLAGLLVWQIAQRCAPSNPFHADPSQLEAVELRYIDLFFGKPDVAVSLTDPASIRAFCSIWNADYVTEIHPYDAHGYTGLVEMPSGSSDGLRICLMYRDGSTRTIEGLGGDMVYFDGHWCYASCGKSYGYQPVIRFTGGIEARAERIRQEETP